MKTLIAAREQIAPTRMSPATRAVPAHAVKGPRTRWWALQINARAIAQLLTGVAAASTVIFGMSTLVGLWAAYDRSAAMGRLGLLATGLMLVALLVWSAWHSRQQGHDALRIFTAVGLDSGMMAGGIGLLFLLTHKWQNDSAADFTLLPQLTAWIQNRQPLWGEGLVLHENLVAGALIALLPLAVIALWQSWCTPGLWQQMPLRYWSLVGVVIGIGALLLTFSRSAWIGLLGGTIVALYLYWRTDAGVNQQRARQRAHRMRHQQFAQRHGRKSPSRIQYWLDFLLEEPVVVDVLLLIAVLAGVGLLIGVTLSPTLHELIVRPVAGTYLASTINSRLAAWQEALPVIQDYPLTGSGLGSTAMVLATYVYLLHVPFLYHAHSLYLQIAVEQGLPGLLGYVGMMLSALGFGWFWLVRGTAQGRLYAAGALTAQIALLIYGATDAELFVGILMPFLFLPTALLFACAGHDSTASKADAPRVSTALALSPTHKYARQPMAWSRRERWFGGGVVVPMAALLVLLLFPGAESRWLVNLVTVGQTRQELALYNWPTWPLQDALRRSELVDTPRWIAQYEAVLERDPTNVTALRRLGQIVLAQGDYARADELLSAAYRVAPRQRATRQLLGEVKALLGDETAAANLWQGLDLSQGQPDLRLWWYEHADGTVAAQHFAHFLETR